MPRKARDPFVEWLEKEISKDLTSDVESQTWVAIELHKTKRSDPGHKYAAYTTIKGKEAMVGGAHVWGYGDTPKQAVMQSIGAAFISLTPDLKVTSPIPGIRTDEWSTTE
jgi:hypothetical protein